MKTTTVRRDGVTQRPDMRGPNSTALTSRNATNACSHFACDQPSVGSVVVSIVCVIANCVTGGPGGVGGWGRGAVR